MIPEASAGIRQSRVCEKDEQRRTLSMRGCHRGSGIGQLSKEGIRIYVGASRCRPVCRNTLQRWETEFCKDDADNTGIEAHMMGAIERESGGMTIPWPSEHEKNIWSVT